MHQGGFRVQGNECSHAPDHILATNAILSKSHSSMKAEVLVQSHWGKKEKRRYRGEWTHMSYALIVPCNVFILRRGEEAR